MAELSLKIKADFAEASKQFNNLAENSENLQKKIEKLNKIYGEEQADKFIEKQKLAGIAMSATGRSVEGLKNQHKAYDVEIQRLIKNGMDPASNSIKKLKDEQENLNKELAKSGQYTGDAAKGVEAMGKATEIAVKASIALGAALVAMTHKTAELGNEVAKTSRSVGLSAETFQELQYAANQSGVDNLGGSLQKLNKNMADLRRGSGPLNSALKNTNKVLHEQLGAAKSNEEAFDLLMKAIKDAPDEFTRAEIATAAFGREGHKMINMAMVGADGIADLREEARKFGVMSNESAANSEKYADAVTRIKAALQGAQIQLTEKLLPGITKIIDEVANFIAGIDDWDRVLKTVGITIGVVTGLLTAFMVVTKGVAMIKAFSSSIIILTGAFKALTLAMATNPIGLIITGIVAGVAALVAGIMAIIKNWNIIETHLRQGLARVEFAFRWLASVVQMVMTGGFDLVKLAGAELIDFIVGNILRTIGGILDAVGNIIPAAKTAANAIHGLAGGIRDIRDEVRKSTDETAGAAIRAQQDAQAIMQANLNAVDAEMEARREAIRAARNRADEEMDMETEVADWAISEEERVLNETGRIGNDRVAEATQTLKEKLQQITLTENQFLTQQTREVADFLRQRAELESDCYIERIAAVERHSEEILALYAEGSLERVAIEQAMYNTIESLQENAAKKERELLEMRLGAITDFTGGFSKLFTELGKENSKFAKLSQATAAGEAGINSYLAYTKALASTPPPYNVVVASGVLASGLAQQMKIWNTNIPSAETGGRFIVPDLSPRVDGIGMRVNPGEEINVTSRGESSNQPIRIVINFDGKPLIDFTNDNLRSGDIYEMSPGWTQ